MRRLNPGLLLLASPLIALMLTSCATTTTYSNDGYEAYNSYNPASYYDRLPQQIASTGDTVLVDPNVHAWGAYRNGELIKAGLATAGADYCPDIERPCRTRAGTFRIQSLGSADCKSTLYPLPHGGAPMPYCMYFNGSQGLHGSVPGNVVEDNVSHGCVRMHVADAEWLRYDFANVGTKVIIRPY